MYLTQGLHRSLQRHPEKIALCHLAPEDERSWSFARLADEVGRRAAVLQTHGISHGDRVAILAPNNDEIVITMLACWWLGAIACPMNVRWSVPELRHAISDCGAPLLVADPAFATTAAELADIVTVAGADTLAAEALDRVPLEDVRAGGDALAAILYTGGTTGRSKGVMLSHMNFWSASMTRGAELNNAPDSVSLLVAPLFHVAGLGRFVGQSIVGGTCITLPQFRADAVLDAVERHRISDIIVVPTMLQALLDAPGFLPARARSLTRIAFGAAPMPPDLLDRALAAWPHAEFFQAYGLTETAGAVCINLPVNHRPEAIARGLLRSVGRAGLGAEIRIVDERGEDCPRGEVGELVVRGPMVTRGYWNLPEVSAQALRQGWFHTGDGARMDADGYLFIADRLKDMIITGGENVYSGEVEAALRSHPSVVDAAVIGVADARWGESVHAEVVLHADAALASAEEAVVFETLVAWCRTQLAGYKCPRSLRRIDALPLSAAGKVLKTTLRAEHARRCAERVAEAGA
ncbi:class I adenylate-forming enzyme family protein [Variovorax sp. UMC13]|uniref:class I adenylate-forming enzyme family protein n=1 Tax=Variovorax sp. UMC13 TaxID=1862326 RepID=UPI0015FF4D87|nr:AMP-binding protein [Variovorax sp. UMC13]MBB1603789.1 AMP-dependent synthetase [Variovorax sp. UMC13]